MTQAAVLYWCNVALMGAGWAAGAGDPALARRHDTLMLAI